MRHEPRTQITSCELWTLFVFIVYIIFFESSLLLQFHVIEMCFGLSERESIEAFNDNLDK